MESSYQPVMHRTARALIVATGPSVAGVDLSPARYASVIAINGAVKWCEPASIFFSLDPSLYVRSLLTPRRPAVRYYMAVPDGYGTPHARIRAHRTRPEAGVHYLRRVAGDGPWNAREKLSDDRASIHTGNSVWGALGLAYHMGATRIAIVGMDGTQEAYAFDSARRPRNDFAHLPALFATALPQLSSRGIQVVNGSPDSIVDCFPRMTGDEAVRWLLR